MSFLTQLISLGEGEHILRVARRNFSVLFLPILLTLVALWFLLLSLFSLFRFGNFGNMLFFFLLSLVLLYIIRAAFVWYYNALIITNVRLVIIEQHHLFQRHKKEILLRHIEKVFTCPPRFFERVFFERTFEFTFHGTKKILKLKRIRDFIKMKTLFETLLEGQKTIVTNQTEKALQFPLEFPEIFVQTIRDKEAEEIVKECMELLFLLQHRVGKEKFMKILSEKKI